jgi:hypothetical protein
MTKRLRIRPGTQILIALIAITLGIWILRGVGVLTFLPGMIIWLLMILCFVVLIVNSLRAAR